MDRFLKYGSNLEPNLSRLEYGGSWYMFVRTLLSPMLKDSGLKGTLAPNQIFSTTVKLYTHSVWKDINKYLNADDTFPGIEETFQNTERDLLGEEHPEDMAYALPPKIDTGEKRAEIIGAQPRLTGISVENFKSLASIDIKIGKVEDQSKLVTQDVEYNHHTDCLLMLGENATGKSSLLEAVAMATISSGALTALQDDPVIGIKPDHLILNPKYMGSPKAKVPKAAKIKLTFKDNTDTNITRSLAINPKGFVQSKSTEDDILIFAYGAHRLFGISGKDDEADNPAQDVLTLFRNDVMTIDPEKWLIELDTRNDGSLDIIARALRHVIQLDGKFENIEIVREKGQKPFCQINLKRAQIGTALGDDVGTDESYIFSTPMKYVSSGYRVIIALICDVFKGIMEHLERRVGDSGLAVTAELAREMSVLILIDEVEAHLHPRWKLEVISGLRRALPQATFLMSSHDPLCIRGMNNGEVIVFHRYQLDNGSDKVTREKVETITEFPDFRQLTVEQLLTSELFSLYSTDDRRIEKEFGNIITLLAQEKQGEINKSGQDMLTAFRSHVTEQLHKALPVGSTEIDRLVHEAVEEFLSKRRTNNQAETDKLRHAAKIKIIDALEKIAGPTA
ncbi:MAG: AAA family ATPase [Litorimonas sp.]